MIISATHPLYEHRKTLTSPYLNEDILNRLHSLTKTKKINGIYLILDKEVFHSKEYPAFYLQDASPEESFNDKTDITAKYGDACLLYTSTAVGPWVSLPCVGEHPSFKGVPA